MGCCQSDAVKTAESSRAPSEVPKSAAHSSVVRRPDGEPVVLGGKGSTLEGEKSDAANTAAAQRLSITQSDIHDRLGKSTISPIPVFVFKTMQEVDGKFDKVFLNVFAHKKVEKDHLLIHNKDPVQDKKGGTCYAYSVVLSDEAGQKCLRDESYKLWTSEQVVNVLNIVYTASIDVTKIKFPIMKKGFVGDTIPFFSLEEDVVSMKNPLIAVLKKDGKRDEKNNGRRSISGSVMHTLFGGLMPSSSPSTPPPLAAVLSLEGDTVPADSGSKVVTIEEKEESPHPHHTDTHHPVVPPSHSAAAAATHDSLYSKAKLPTTTTSAAVPATISVTGPESKAGEHSPITKEATTSAINTASTLSVAHGTAASTAAQGTAGSGAAHGTASAAAAPSSSTGITFAAPAVGLPPLAPGHVYLNSSPKPIGDLYPTLSISQVAVPRRLTGWIKKQGHFAKNWKMRYFVLDRGMLTYYVDESPTPPYGTEMKGQLCLAGYREKSLMADSEAAASTTATSQQALDRTRTQMSTTEDTFNEASSTLQIQLQYYPNIVSPEVVDELNKHFGRGAPEQSHKEFLMVCQSLDAKEAWLAALEAHTSYIETIALKFKQDMETNPNGTAASANNNNTSNSSMGSGRGSPSPITRQEHSYSISSAISSLSRNGSKNNVSGRPKVSRASRQASITLSAQKWAIFLNRNEKMVLAGLVEKPNPVGYRYMRNLLLVKYEAPEGVEQGPVACRKRLIYIDSNSYEKKGEILWLEEPRAARPTITTKDDYFDIVDGNGKSYRFYPKDDLSVAQWIAEINGLPPV